MAERSDPGLDITQRRNMLQNLVNFSSTSVAQQGPRLVPKDVLNAVVNAASTPRDRKLIRAIASYGLSAKAARTIYGIRNCNHLKTEVLEGLNEIAGIVAESEQLIYANEQKALMSLFEKHKINVELLPDEEKDAIIGEDSGYQKAHRMLARALARAFGSTSPESENQSEQDAPCPDLKEVVREIDAAILREDGAEEMGDLEGTEVDEEIAGDLRLEAGTVI